MTWTRNKRQRRAVKNIVELKIKGTENGAETKEEMECVNKKLNIADLTVDITKAKNDPIKVKNCTDEKVLRNCCILSKQKLRLPLSNFKKNKTI